MRHQAVCLLQLNFLGTWQVGHFLVLRFSYSAFSGRVVHCLPGGVGRRPLRSPADDFGELRAAEQPVGALATEKLHDVTRRSSWLYSKPSENLLFLSAFFRSVVCRGVDATHAEGLFRAGRASQLLRGPIAFESC